jgi:tetratricopeptide (TPR) repeat protein
MKAPRWLICALLAAVTLAVFGRTIANDFVNLDDGFYIYQNPVVTAGLSWKGVVAAFTHGSPANWDPLTTISHMADCEIFGLKPWGHHAVNILLHTATVVLLFVTLQEMTGGIWESAFAALLFAIHPLRVESVAWVTERKDVLSGLFFVLTLWAYGRFCRRRGWWAYAWPVFFFALGLMSKAMLVTTPVVLLLLDWWPLDRFRGRSGVRRLLLEKVPLAALSILSAVAAYLAQGPAVGSAKQFPILTRLGNSLISCAAYLRQSLWPRGLAAYYPYPRHGLAAWTVVLSAALLIVITALALAWRKERPYLLMGWLWYLAMLLPVIGLVQLGAQAHADRYTYLPQIGLCVALSWLVRDASLRWPRRRLLLATAVGLVFVALGTASTVQAGYWHDSVRLWVRTLACTRDNAFAEYNYGMTLVKLNRPAEGAEHLRRAIEIQPTYVDAYNNLGSVYLNADKPEAAISEYDQALALTPNDASIQHNLGLALWQSGKTNDAIDHLESAVAIDPSDADAQLTLGRIAWSLATNPDPARRNGALATAVATQVVKLSAGLNAGYLLTLAAANAESGRFDDAAKLANQAVSLARRQGNAREEQFFESNSVLFRSGHPYRDVSLINSNRVL